MNDNDKEENYPDDPRMRIISELCALDEGTARGEFDAADFARFLSLLHRWCDSVDRFKAIGRILCSK